MESHVRGITKEVQYNPGKDFEVQAIVKPGANSEPTGNMTNSNVTRLTKENVCIIWGRTWDVAKNETEMCLCLLKKSGSRHQHTNLVMMSVPHRYDLAMESCVNNEIKVFDKKLKKCNNSTDNIWAIEVNTDREVYKRNGLHMKQNGKKQKR